MPVFDTECIKCKKIIEQVCVHNEDFDPCPFCGAECKKIAPQTAPSFTLKYNPRTDICDWDGRTTRYWDEYRSRKDAGENVRIPEEDGESRHRK
jgi:hypothetical protein